MTLLMIYCNCLRAAYTKILCVYVWRIFYKEYTARGYCVLHTPILMHGGEVLRPATTSSRGSSKLYCILYFHFVFFKQKNLLNFCIFD